MASNPPSYQLGSLRFLRGYALNSNEKRVHSIRRGFQDILRTPLLLAILLLTSCVEDSASVSAPDIPELDPLAWDFFVMRNPEIREDLLQQLEIHGIKYWINSNGSIGFYVRDTKEVDRLANEAIGVYISLQ
ncbi:MAG: hypothetical protein VXZ91_01070 [Pseudomonadota bacterium]|nr:hypothetical protein [Pseudomonadota bacterium]